MSTQVRGYARVHDAHYQSRDDGLQQQHGNSVGDFEILGGPLLQTHLVQHQSMEPHRHQHLAQTNRDRTETKESLRKYEFGMTSNM